MNSKSTYYVQIATFFAWFAYLHYKDLPTGVILGALIGYQAGKALVELILKDNE